MAEGKGQNANFYLFLKKKVSLSLRVYAEADNISSLDPWCERNNHAAQCADILLHKSMLSSSLYHECSQSEQGNLTSRLSAGDGHVRPCNERGSSTSNETQVRCCLQELRSSRTRRTHASTFFPFLIIKRAAQQRRLLGSHLIFASAFHRTHLH